MRLTKQSIFLALTTLVWAGTVAWGMSRTWKYEATAGVAARAPMTRPHDVSDGAAGVQSDVPELVVLIHPRCPCSRATLAELNRLMSDCRGKLVATVLMVRPDGAPEGWERTSLWSIAAAIPGVTVRADAGGEAARQFGAATSGQAILYAPGDGRLLFSGGITAGRGHEGDNDGARAIAALVLKDGGGSVAPGTTPVYGCPLFDASQLTLPSNFSERITACPTK